MFYFLMESTYENGLFASIKTDLQSRLDANDNTDSLFVKAMEDCYHLMHNRYPTYAGTTGILGPEGGVFHSTSVDLMTTNGACGSYSQVLARIIRTFHFPVRIAQMKAGGEFGAHNVVEAYDGKRWILRDPDFQPVCRADRRMPSWLGFAQWTSTPGLSSHQTRCVPAAMT